ncbi:hypothetical protein SK128_012902 [Halocaridina rubra]|uniref:non-specific serine/threonine protein kinase n=1 Tax=Halocaridina rubra TaxID=373956 RepID=A0AAN8XM93_HALRR
MYPLITRLFDSRAWITFIVLFRAISGYFYNSRSYKMKIPREITSKRCSRSLKSASSGWIPDLSSYSGCRGIVNRLSLFLYKQKYLWKFIIKKPSPVLTSRVVSSADLSLRELEEQLMQHSDFEHLVKSDIIEEAKALEVPLVSLKSLNFSKKEYLGGGAVGRAYVKSFTDVGTVCIKLCLYKDKRLGWIEVLQEARNALVLKGIEGTTQLLALCPVEPFGLIISYAGSKNLLGYLKTRGSEKDDKQVLWILIEVLQILKNIHERGLSHNDVTSRNIVISGVTRRPTLIDYGHSRELGSYFFCPHVLQVPWPENLGLVPLTSTVDIYSFGRMLMNLLRYIEDKKIKRGLRKISMKCLMKKMENIDIVIEEFKKLLI